MLSPLAPHVSKKPIHSRPHLSKSVSTPNLTPHETTLISPPRRTLSVPTLVATTMSTTTSTLNSTPLRLSIPLSSHSSSLSTSSLSSSLSTSSRSSLTSRSSPLSATCHPHSTSSVPWLPVELIAVVSEYLTFRDLCRLRLVHPLYTRVASRVLLGRVTAHLARPPGVGLHELVEMRMLLRTYEERQVPLLGLLQPAHLAALVRANTSTPPVVAVRWVCECLVRLATARCVWSPYAPGRMPWSIVQRELRRPDRAAAVLAVTHVPMSQTDAVVAMLNHPDLTYANVFRESLQAYYALVFIASIVEASFVHEQVREVESEVHMVLRARERLGVFVKMLRRHAS